MAPYPYLLSRSLDPLLGVFTGALAFHLHQTNPRTAPPEGETLQELVRWKRLKTAAERQKQLEMNELDKDIERMLSSEEEVVGRSR